MTSEKLVSVIINTYNDADVLKNAVLSALNQTWEHLELIVYDNASSDNTLEILAGVKDERMRTILASRHTNLSTARNIALDCSLGDYVCFLDSDDTWAPEKLALQIQAIEENDLEFCFTNFHFSDSGHVNEPTYKGKSLNTSFHKIPFEIGYPAALSTLCFRRSSLDRAPFEEDTHITGDYRLVTRLARNNKWQMLVEPLVIITRRSEGESASKAELMVGELIDYSDILREQGIKSASSFVRLRALEIGAQKLKSDVNSAGLLRRIMSRPYFLRYAPSYLYHRLHQTIRMRR